MAKNESYSVKHEIIDAVMQLMTEKNYMDITVTDIVKKAGVARASFYRNFNSINDVIDVIVDEISDELIGDIFPTLYSSDERKWREFLFNHFYRFTRKQQQMGKIHPQNLNVLFARMANKMQQKESNFPAETIRDKYIAIGTVGLINSITKKWMDSGAKETPEEMIDFIMSLFFSVKK